MLGISNAKLAQILGAVVLALPALTPSISYAQSENTEGRDLGLYRIDIAGRQRMLTQRMAKAICFIELGHEVTQHHEMLDNDRHLFEDTLHILLEGGGENDIPAETDRRTLVGLNGVLEDWKAFQDVIAQIIESDEISEEMEDFVFQANVEILQDMNNAVSMIEQEYANPHDVVMEQALTINVAGRQRMLSQKATKDFCFVAVGHHSDEARAALVADQGMFSVSLDALTNGMAAVGILPPPSEEIKAQLLVVAEIWAPMEQIFNNVSEGNTPTPEEISFIASENNRLLVEMNKAVQMYKNL